MGSQFLDLDGLKQVKTACDKSYALRDHTHNVSDLDDFSTKVWDATLSRNAGTVLAAPASTDGAASFRQLTSHYLPKNYDSRGVIGTATNWDSCNTDGFYRVSSSDAFTGTGHPPSTMCSYTYGILLVSKIDNVVYTQIYISHQGDVAYRQAWSTTNGVPNYSSWMFPVKTISDGVINGLFTTA